jgi:putative zinc finger protein
MTTNAMSCELFNDGLMAYLEHETDDATRAALERHALSCAECGAVLADLRKLRIEAANLPELTPSRDLWSGIAERIEAPVVPIGTVRHVEQDRAVAARKWTRRALLAASLVAAVGVGYFAATARRVQIQVVDTHGVDAAPQQQVADVTPEIANQPTGAEQPNNARSEPRAGTAALAQPIRQPEAIVAVATLNADYDREIARLRTLIEQRRNQLDPVTVAIIEKNLQVIDSAILECKKAIARDPSSRFLIEALNQSLQTKVELMRTAALLPVRT